jgi:Ca-activated chloride channel family protein
MTRSSLRCSTMLLALSLALLGCGSGELRFVDLWLTRDQQGQRAFDRGDLENATRLFEDPMWRGSGLYLSERFEASLAEFARLDTAEAWFARGNALAHLERYEEAIEAYEQALERRSDFPEAAANIEYLQPFLPLELKGGVMGVVGRDAAADDVVFDADADQLEDQGVDTTMERETGLLSDEQLAEMWLRQVDTSPASFLRYKFGYQAARAGGER